MSGLLSFYIGASLFFVVDAIQKITSFQKHTWSYIFFRSIFTSAISITLAFIFFGWNNFPSWQKLIPISSACVICTLGLFFYIKAVNTLHFSNVGALTVVGNVFQQLVGFLVFKETFQWSDLVSLSLMASGSILQVSLSKNKTGALFVLASTISWTSGYVLLSRLMDDSTIGWTVPIMECIVLLTSVFMLLFRNESINFNSQIQSKKQIFFMIIIGVFVFFASYMNNAAYKYVPVSVISMLQLSLIPIGYILSLRIFKEKPSTLELISFITGFGGFGIHVIAHWI